MMDTFLSCRIYTIIHSLTFCTQFIVFIILVLSTSCFTVALLSFTDYCITRQVLTFWKKICSYVSVEFAHWCRASPWHRKNKILAREQHKRTRGPHLNPFLHKHNRNTSNAQYVGVVSTTHLEYTNTQRFSNSPTRRSLFDILG